MGVKRNLNNICPRCKSAERNPSHGWCTICRRDYTKQYKKDNPKSQAGYALKHKYGLSVADKNRMILEQSFKCASCAIDFDLHKQIHVDHCHDTGAIRGILCSDCNISLGRMKENPERIRGLAVYADKIQATRTNPSSLSPPPTAFGGGGERDRAPTGPIPAPTNHGE